ncbi:transposon Ty3-G Gag-Pol polyprotein [Trichonephila clavipes]|nr:transposon Ty3-G Gag-Pol polyprotein [Trichonephila clavipes]
MKNDLKATSSELVYGTTLRLPSDLISSESLQTSVTPTYFRRNDKIRPPLTPPYTGPHMIKSRSDKNFVICINNKNVTVTIDRCKPAFEFSEDF